MLNTWSQYFPRVLSSGNGVSSNKDKVRNTVTELLCLVIEVIVVQLDRKMPLFSSALFSLLLLSLLSTLTIDTLQRVCFVSCCFCLSLPAPGVFQQKSLVRCACGQPCCCFCLCTNGNWGVAQEPWRRKTEVGPSSSLFYVHIWSIKWRVDFFSTSEFSVMRINTTRLVQANWKKQV